MVTKGNPNSVTDAGVGAIALHAAIGGAWLNVQINAIDLKDHTEVKQMLSAGRDLAQESDKWRKRILNEIQGRLNS